MEKIDFQSSFRADGKTHKINDHLLITWSLKRQQKDRINGKGKIIRGQQSSVWSSRLDVSFGFELHTIRGRNKMKLRCGLSLCVMLAMALGRIKENQQEKMRSLVSA